MSRRRAVFVGAPLALALVLGSLLVCVRGQFTPARATANLVSQWNFNEASGTTAADSAPLTPPLPLNAFGGPATWRTDTYGVTIGPASPGFVGNDVGGVGKIFSSVEVPRGYQYSMEAWVRPMAFPAADGQTTIAQLCDSPQDFNDNSVLSPCLKLGIYSPTGSTANSTFSFAMSLVWDDLSGSYLKIDAFGFSQEFARTPGLVHHIVARYNVTVPAPEGAISPGAGLSEIFVDGAPLSNVIIGSRTTTGEPISCWPINPAPPSDPLYAWRYHPAPAQRLSVGFSFDSSGTVMPATAYSGDVFQIAYFARSLTNAEIANNYLAGPPSRAPTALVQPSPVTISEDGNATVVLPVSDPDQVLGFDMALSASVLSLTFTSPIASFFTSPGVLLNLNGSTVLGTCLSMGAGGPSVVFVPAVGFYGTVNITFAGLDSRGVRSANAQSFIITVTNVQHLAAAVFSSTTTYAGQSVSMPLGGTCLDPEALLVPTVTQLPNGILYGSLYRPDGAGVVQNQEIAPTGRLTPVTFTPHNAIESLNRLPAVNADFTFRVRHSLTSQVSADALGRFSIVNNAVATAAAYVMTEDTRLAITLAGVDLLPGGSISGFTVCRQPAAGTLYQHGTNTPALVEDAVTDTLGRIDYQPDMDFNQQDFFQFCATSAVSGAESVPAAITINVTNVNDAPRPIASTWEMFYLQHNTTIMLSAYEPDGDAMQFTVLSVPSLVQVFVQQYGSGAAVSSGTVVADIDERLVVIANQPTVTGTQGYWVSISFTSQDVYGVVGTPAAASVLIKNKLYAANLTVAVVEDATANFSLSTTEYTGLPYITSLVSLPKSGTLALFATPATAITAAPAEVAGTQRLIYTPAPNFFGSDSFMYSVTRGGEVVTATVTLLVSSVPDAPLIALPAPDKLVAIDGVVLSIASLSVRNVDNSSAPIQLNITSLTTSVVAFATSTDFETSLFADGTGEYIDGTLLAPLKFVTSAAQRVTVQSVHQISIEAISVGRRSRTVLSIQVLPSNARDNNALDRVVVAAVAAASGAALIFGAVGAIVLFKRRTREPRMPPPPPFERYIFAGIVAPANKVDPRTGTDLIALLQADEYTLLFALLHVTAAADSDDLARHLVHIAEAQNTSSNMIVRVLTRETELVDDGSMLLRSTSFAAKMMGVYARMVGMPYLYKTLGPRMLQAQLQDVSLEVDPSKVRRRDEVDVRVNTWQLLVVSQEFLKAIVDSVDAIPLELRTIAQVIDREVGRAFPERRSIAVGSFLFVRFLVPAIAQPELCGLLPGPPSRELRRLLVLVAKTLQNVANGTVFKEEHLASMNVFIQSNIAPVAEFLSEVAAVPSNRSRSPPCPVPQYAADAALAYVYAHTANVRGDINALVDAEGAPPLIKMRDSLNRIYASGPGSAAGARTIAVQGPGASASPAAAGGASAGAGVGNL